MPHVQARLFCPSCHNLTACSNRAHELSTGSCWLCEDVGPWAWCKVAADEWRKLGVTDDELTTIPEKGEPEMTLVLPKIPTIFKTGPDQQLIPELTPGCEWVLTNCIMTVKVDGVQAKVNEGPDKKLRIWKRVRAFTGEYVFVLCTENNPADDPYIEALKNSSGVNEGLYEVYGPKINGNPHGVSEHLMVKVVPADNSLLVTFLNTGIKRDNAKEFFETVRAELEASPAIEGLVWAYEPVAMKPEKWAQITRKDFGFTWPPPSATKPASTAHSNRIEIRICDECHERRTKDTTTGKLVRICNVVHPAVVSSLCCRVCGKVPRNQFLNKCNSGTFTEVYDEKGGLLELKQATPFQSGQDLVPQPLPIVGN